jgi:Rhodanese-like domain
MGRGLYWSRRAGLAAAAGTPEPVGRDHSMERPMLRVILKTMIGALALALLPGLVAAGPGKAKPEKDPFGRLTVNQVQKRLADPNVHVYDGNRDELYEEHHLPGAVHLLHNDIKEGVLPADKSATLIFYCHNEL